MLFGKSEWWAGMSATVLNLFPALRMVTLSQFRRTGKLVPLMRPLLPTLSKLVNLARLYSPQITKLPRRRNSSTGPRPSPSQSNLKLKNKDFTVTVICSSLLQPQEQEHCAVQLNSFIRGGVLFFICFIKLFCFKSGVGLFHLSLRQFAIWVLELDKTFAISLSGRASFVHETINVCLHCHILLCL